MQRREDDFQRGFVLEFRVRIDRDAASIIADRQRSIFQERDVDPACMPRDRFVHRVVENLGGQMMQCGLIGAADIHAGPAPDRFEPFENLDVFCGIGSALSGGILKQISHGCIIICTSYEASL